MSGRQTLTIEFHHDGREPLDAPVPTPMSGVQPDWFRAMPAAVPETLRQPEDVSRLTVRACAPFAEAMSAGYALLWPSTTDIILVGRYPDGSFDVRFEPAQPAILNQHPTRQAPGMPSAALPMLKLLNPRIIRTPEGTSCLFTPLLNRPEVQIIPFGAIVETDRFFAPIHLPFLLVPPPGGRVRIERGTPVAQIIPFRRENWASVRGQGDGAARAATAAIMTAENEGAYARRIRMRGQFR